MENAKLKKDNLNVIETIAMSAAIMAPSASMALNISLATSVAGYSVSLIYIIATIITFFIAVSIIKFSRDYSSAGSLYSFASAGLGRRLGFVAGWTQALTYFMLSLGCSAAFGSYISSMFGLFNVHVSWLPVSLLVSIVVWILAYTNIKLNTRIMLVFETVSIALILILSFVILFKVGMMTGLSLSPFKLNGNSFSVMAQASIFGLLSFAGFEGTSCLGEETKNPKKHIPFVIILTVVFIGCYFLISSYTQVIGFGITAKGISALSASTAPLDDLSIRYISKGYAFLITLSVSLALISCVIGCVCAGARILFGISRDGYLHTGMSKVHKKFHTPYVTVSVGMSVLIVIQLIYYILTRGEGKILFNYVATIASLSILVAYILTSISAMIYYSKRKIWKPVNLIIPVLAIITLAYAFYSNIYPVPAFPANLFPYIIFGWVILGVVLCFAAHPHRAKPAGKAENVPGEILEKELLTQDLKRP